MRTAASAANLLPDQKWCLATGPVLPEAVSKLLQSKVPDNVTVVSMLNNLAAHLSRARVSVSQCGYNTAMDVLKSHRESRCRAVLVPYDTEGQSEQLRRAELLEAAGFAINLPQSRLGKEALVKAIKCAQDLPRVDHDIDFCGVENTASLIRNWIDRR